MLQEMSVNPSRAGTDEHQLLDSPRGRRGSRPTASGMHKGFIYAGVVVVFALFALQLVAVFRYGKTVLDAGTCVDWREEVCLADNCQATPEPQDATSPGTVLTNAEIWIGDETTISTGAIRFENGIITDVGKSIEPKDNDVVIDVRGGIVTPGIVDMHSHLGVYGYPDELDANDDGNEMTNPITPFVRAIDGFDSEDPGIKMSAEGGITTIQLLPGSGNDMGGEGARLKLRGDTIEEMQIRGGPKALKWACGENPKRVYGTRDEMPMSRMGSAWKMREALAKAANIMNNTMICGDRGALDRVLESNPLVALLSGQAVLNVHCYQTHDMEMIVRLSKEFNFRIAAFHHALEAYKIPDIVKREGIAVATFADHWGYKMEAYDASVYGPKVLRDAGVKLVLKSDHPVLHSGFMNHEAAKSVHWGLDPQTAIRAITLTPAQAIGLDSRVGSLHVGKDADVIVWDGHPFLTMGARPSKVYIDGLAVVDGEISDPTPASETPPNPEVTSSKEISTQPTKVASYALKNIKSKFDHDQAKSVEGPFSVRVEHGKIKCIEIGDSCVTDSVDVTVDFKGEHTIMAGAIESGSYLGLKEIGAEKATNDGRLSVDAEDALSVTAADGVRMGTRTLRAAFAGGVTTAISRINNEGVVKGVSSAFRTQGLSSRHDASIVSQAGVHVELGNGGKGDGLSASWSGQVALLRKYLSNGKAENNTVWRKVVDGDLPLVVEADSADVIATAIYLTKTELDIPKVVILGGAEAHVVADIIAANGVAVVLSGGVRRVPASWDSRRSTFSNIALLDKAGVRDIGIAVGDKYAAFNLRFEAGLAHSLGISQEQALNCITLNVAKAFGLQDRLGKVAVGQEGGVVVASGNPISFTSKIVFSGAGDFVQLHPSQYDGTDSKDNWPGLSS